MIDDGIAKFMSTERDRKYRSIKLAVDYTKICFPAYAENSVCEEDLNEDDMVVPFAACFDKNEYGGHTSDELISIFLQKIDSDFITKLKGMFGRL